MSAADTCGTILIRESTILPAGLAVESELFLPGWRAVLNLDPYGLGRKIEQAKWYFFYLAGEIRTTVLGRDRSTTLRRAVKRVLAKQSVQFNCLEITKVVSKRFLGIPFMSVAAHTRHIQQDICLVAGKRSALGMRAPAELETMPNSGGQPVTADGVRTPHTVLVSSS